MFETDRDLGDETDAVRPATLEEAVREVLDNTTGCCCDKCRARLARDLSQCTERYGAALHCRGGWTLAQAEVPALAAFTGDTLRRERRRERIYDRRDCAMYFL